jgi:hypothetical protein
LTTFDVIIVKVQESFTKNQNPKLIEFNEFEFEFLNIQISHLTQVEMIDMNLRFGKNIYVLKSLQFSRLSNMVFEHICTQIGDKIV